MPKKRIFILALLLGLLLAILFKAIGSDIKYLSLKELYTQSIEFENLERERVQLEEKKKDLEAQIATFKTAAEDVRIDYMEVLSEELKQTRMAAGDVALEGPGVIILVSDGTRELLGDENPNVLLVHDLDIRAMVDDLRNAGAEAIAINNQRVVFNKSKIRCTGPTIKINDQVFAPPYVIKAIGDGKFLEAAINAPGSFSEDLRAWGVFVEVNTAIHVEIPAYDGFSWQIEGRR